MRRPYGQDEPVADYPERFAECHCWENARRMAELHPELAVVEGFLVFPRAAGFEDYRLEHAWNLAPDGTVVDATAWAYEGLRPFRYAPSEGPGGRAR
jgi:hypothetical protein